MYIVLALAVLVLPATYIARIFLRPRKLAIRTALRRELKKQGVTEVQVPDLCLSDISDFILRLDNIYPTKNFEEKAQQQAEAVKMTVSLILTYLADERCRPDGADPVYASLQKHGASITGIRSR